MEPAGLAQSALAVRAREAATARLQERYQGILAPQTVARFVASTFDDVALRSRVPQWVPLVAEQLAEERLQAVAVLDVPAPRRRPQVLFVCEHNAGRSQLAAAILASLAGEQLGVWSAGETPAQEIEPRVARLIDQLGVDAGAARPAFPKPLLDEVVAAADVIVTMGCGDACPVLPGKRYVDWPIADPAYADAAGLQAIRRDITSRVVALLDEILPTSPPT